MTEPLFACSRCFSRHPFEELSQGQQFCKECRGSYPVVKCTYCRSEFQQESKGSVATICKKCGINMKQYGKPTNCEYCNTIAAFIGNKCQRCANSEKKYGPPLCCDQCKQRCAFDRKDEDKVKKIRSFRKRAISCKDIADDSIIKRGSRLSTDTGSSDMMVAIAELKEQMALLQKQLAFKDQQLLGKEKQMTELKAQNLLMEQALRRKMKEMEKEYRTQSENHQNKIKELYKQLAALSKGASKPRFQEKPKFDSPIIG